MHGFKDNTYMWMLFLNKFEEGIHIWSAKVIYGFQASEHTAVGDTLKVILANVLQDETEMSQCRTCY